MQDNSDVDVLGASHVSVIRVEAGDEEDEEAGEELLDLEEIAGRFVGTVNIGDADNIVLRASFRGERKNILGYKVGKLHNLLK